MTATEIAGSAQLLIRRSSDHDRRGWVLDLERRAVVPTSGVFENAKMATFAGSAFCISSSVPWSLEGAELTPLR